jgi:hypothetical protein
MAKQPDTRPPLQRALDTAAGLKAGTWESVRALGWLARADRLLAGGESS